MQVKKNYVSVVIPCYNHGAYIQETLQSVLAQTWKKYEVIIVDDGSDDPHTIKVLDRVKHPKVTVLRKENGHVSSARNYGIRRSAGEYILTLDADDQFEPDFLEKGIQVLNRRKEVGVVTCYVRLIDHKGNVHMVKPRGGGIRNFLANNNCMASALFRYRCWEDAGGYNEDYNGTTKGFEDWDFWLSVIRSGWEIYSIPEYLMMYRSNPNSMSAQYVTEIPEMMKRLVQRHEDVYRQNVVDVIYSKELKVRQMREIKDSKTYRVGEAILSPLKFLRRRFRYRAQKVGNRKTLRE